MVVGLLASRRLVTLARPGLPGCLFAQKFCAKFLDLGTGDGSLSDPGTYRFRRLSRTAAAATIPKHDPSLVL